MTYPQYDSYKDSVQPWLGSIPEHWATRRVKFLFKIKKRIAGKTGFNVLSITQNGIKVKDITSGGGQLSMDYSKYQIVQKHDFAMNHMDLLTGYVDISNYDGVTSPDYRVFSLSDDEQLREYFLYIFQMGYKNKIFFALGQGSSQLGRWRFPADEFNNFVVPLPPLEEQKAIAEFIDRKTSQIDTHIDKQERLIALLKERRTAIIYKAVTRGLDENVKLKDSGIDWLSEIPEHWEIKKVSHFFKAKKGQWAAQLTKEYCGTIEGEYPVYSGQTDNNGVMGRINKYEFDAGKEGYLFSTTVGAKAMTVMHIKGRFSLSQNCMIIIPYNKNIYTRYHYYNFQPLFAYERKLIPEHMQASFRMEDLYQYYFALPPIEEQKNIADYLDKESDKTEKLLNTINQEIAALKEYRQSLISNAVTGKIRVI